MTDDRLKDTLLARERAGLDLWARGDTPGYAARLAEHATYFDHVTRERLQGRAAIASHVRAFEGKIDIPRHDIVNAALHHHGDIAVLGFNWDPYDAEGRMIGRWNATSVYGKVDGEWRVIHTHWSMVPQG
jgi:ketosteroid isomerase-like protein